MPKKANENYKGTFKTLVSVTADDSGKLPTEIQVLPKLETMTAPYGPMKIDEATFDQMVGNFDRDVRKAVPIDVDHDGGKAAGWIKKLINKGNEGLWALVEWTSYGEELLTEKLYKLFSPEWSFDYFDPEYSTHHGAVLVAGSLTNRPLFKELPFLVANDGSTGVDFNSKNLTKEKGIVILFNKASDNNIMNKADILKKPVADRTPEEVEFLATVTDFTDEEKSQLENEKAEAAKAEADAKAKADAEAAEAEAKAKEEADAKAKADAEAGATGAPVDNNTASDDKDVTLKASEVARLKAAEAELLKAKEDIRKASIEKEVGTLIANENGGKFMPAGKDALTSFLMACSDDIKEKFLAFAKTLPDVKIAGELGKGGDTSHLTAKEQLSKLIEEMVKASDGKVTVAEATRKVFAANTELANQYDKELQSK